MNKIDIEIKHAENRLAGELSRLDRFRHDKAQADKDLIDSPANSELAMRAAALELQIKAQVAKVERTRAEVQTERERLESPEYKAAAAELEKVNREGLELTAEIIRKLQDDYSDWARWEALRDRSKKLANDLGLNYFDLGKSGAWLGEVKRAVTRWHTRGQYHQNGDIPVEVPEDPEGRGFGN